MKCINSGCCVCPSFISTTAIAQIGTFLVLSLPPLNLTNNKQLCINIAQQIPTLLGIPSILLSINGLFYPVIETQADCAPHLLYADQLKKGCNGVICSRQTISVKFAADSALFNYNGCRRLSKTNGVATNCGNSLFAIASLLSPDTISAEVTKVEEEKQPVNKSAEIIDA